MIIRRMDEFLFLCREAGFSTPAEAQDYMREAEIDCERLYAELDAYLFPEYITNKF